MKSTGGSEARFALKFSGQSCMISITFLYHCKYCMPPVDILVQVVRRIFVTKVVFNPLSPNSDPHPISPNKITLSDQTDRS